MILVGVVASAVGVAIVLSLDWFPAQASTAAREIDFLYDILLVVSVPIFVLVMTVAIYSVWKFRARPGDDSDGAPIHGDARLEVIWVAVPFLIVAVLGAYSWIVMRDIERLEANPLRVGVVGQQFAWHFDYRDASGKRVRTDDLVLPVDRQVEFRIRAADVLHSFWVPAFRLKSDAVPGRETNWVATPSREGTYDVVCAELCGIGHSTMRQKVSVVSAERFNAWLDSQRGAARAGTGAVATAGAVRTAKEVGG
jgi:cytochrome c oxidase subunit 2